MLDGNVFRVLSRIFDIEIPIDTTEGKKHFSHIAGALLPSKRAGEFNQAMMDFGATICKPLPQCPTCFFNANCSAFLKGKQQLLPVKSKRVLVKERWFTYLVLKHKTLYAIQKRIEHDIWQNLFQFLLIETGKAMPFKKQSSMVENDYGIALNSFDIINDKFILNSDYHIKLFISNLYKASIPSFQYGEKILFG